MPVNNLPEAVQHTTEAARDPLAFSILTYAWVLLLSIWGGFVSFAAKVKKGVSRPYNISEWLGEIATSAFTGVITFYSCQYANLDGLLTAVFVAVSGHMGTRIINFIEKQLESRAQRALDDAFSSISEEISDDKTN